MNTSNDKTNDLTEVRIEIGGKFAGYVDIPLLVKQRDEVLHAVIDNYSEDIDSLIAFIDAIIETSGYHRQ